MLSLWFATLFLFFTSLHSLKITLVEDNEDRDVFSLEEFGLVEGGFINISISDFGIVFLPDSDKHEFVGFVVTQTNTEGQALDFLRQAKINHLLQGNKTCPDNIEDNNFGNPLFHQFLNINPDASKFQPTSTNTISWSRYVDTREKWGLYSIIYVNCATAGSSHFHLYSNLFNKGPNYLSAGDTPLPNILFMFAAVYTAMLIFWIRHLRGNTHSLHKVHHMMTVLLVLKLLSVFSQAIDLHYIKVNGSSFFWNIIYFFFVSLQGVFFMTVLVMIGTGWSLLRPVMNEREMKLLLVVLPLQLIANVALIVDEELNKGSQSYFRWRDIFILVDFLCIMMVVLPTTWQIQHFKSITQITDKSQFNLAKLKQFQLFYIQLVVYIYFTRILLFLLGVSLEFNLVYWKTILKETATVLFFFLTAKRFRPAANNPYLKIEQEENYDVVNQNDFDSEFGLDDDYQGDKDFETRKNKYEIEMQ